VRAPTWSEHRLHPFHHDMGWGVATTCKFWFPEASFCRGVFHQVFRAFSQPTQILLETRYGRFAVWAVLVDARCVRARVDARTRAIMGRNPYSSRLLPSTTGGCVLSFLHGIAPPPPLLPASGTAPQCLATPSSSTTAHHRSAAVLGIPLNPASSPALATPCTLKP
jgi:hypothetical protein